MNSKLAVALWLAMLSFGFLLQQTHAQAPYRVLISELMADPTPPVGLPNSEWIELTNPSAEAIPLQGWRLQKAGGSTSGPLPEYLLQSGARVIISTASAVDELSAFGETLRVTSFPSLVNAGDHILLLDENGEAVHAVNYSTAWYKNAVKAEGGWSLEMIDLSNPCAGISNWSASTDAAGGTPGKVNSVNASNPDNQPPKPVAAFMEGNQITLIFDEPLDRDAAESIGHYSILPGLVVIQSEWQSQAPDRVILTTSTPAPQTVYTISLSNLADCSGNTIAAGTTIRSGMVSAPETGDIIINEVLFDPPGDGYDYVELYNRSSKIINIRDLLIANRSSSSGNLGAPLALSEEGRPFFPGEYLLLSADTAWVAGQWRASDRGRFLQMASLPSFPNAQGWVVLLNRSGDIVDELPYSDKWHFALLRNPDGVALERIHIQGATDDPQNWTSAAQSAGFGTPGMPNSQLQPAEAAVGEVNVSPQIFSPDNDGFDDFALITIRMGEPGYMANITIFDAAGRPVRVVQRNGSLGSSATFRWDGLNDKREKLPLGPYIIYTEVFNLSGKRQAYKNTVSLARRF